MRVISFIILFLLITINAFAVTPIYCPECKTHLYDYQYDEIVKNAVFAKDFKPVGDISQPTENSDMNCPLCDSPLNGWEYQGRKYTFICSSNKAIASIHHSLVYSVPGTSYGIHLKPNSSLLNIDIAPHIFVKLLYFLP